MQILSPQWRKQNARTVYKETKYRQPASNWYIISSIPTYHWSNEGKTASGAFSAVGCWTIYWWALNTVRNSFKGIHYTMHICLHPRCDWYIFTLANGILWRRDAVIECPHNSLLYTYICSAQFRNLCNLEIALHILGIRKLRTNLEIAHSILRLRSTFVQSRDCASAIC